MQTILTFAEAVAFLRCTPQWLQQQRDAGLVPYAFNNQQQYIFQLEDLQEVAQRVPTQAEYQASATPRVRTDTPKMTAARLAECRAEARELGLSLDAYLSIVYGATYPVG